MRRRKEYNKKAIGIEVKKRFGSKARLCRNVSEPNEKLVCFKSGEKNIYVMNG